MCSTRVEHGSHFVLIHLTALTERDVSVLLLIGIHIVSTSIRPHEVSKVKDYHQGLGFVVAFLRLFLEAEDVTRIALALHTSERHSRGYFLAEPQAFFRDCCVFGHLLEENPATKSVASHLAHFQALPELYAVKWFVGLGVHTLPLLGLLDFWEAYFQHGFEFLFSFAIAFINEFQSELLAESTTAGVMTILRMEDPSAEWHYPLKLQTGLEDRFQNLHLAALDAIAIDALDHKRLPRMQEEEAVKIAARVERARRQLQEFDEDDVICFSDEDNVDPNSQQ